MTDFSRLLPSLVLAAIAAGCGSSSLTAPDATGTSGASASGTQASASSSPTDLGSTQDIVPPPCEVQALALSLVASRTEPGDRLAHELEVSFRGDPTNCPMPEWSTLPLAPMVVSKDARHVTIYDPNDKFGTVDVSVTLAPHRLTAHQRITFPRETR
jgi:hypothetical protein